MAILSSGAISGTSINGGEMVNSTHFVLATFLNSLLMTDASRTVIWQFSQGFLGSYIIIGVSSTDVWWYIIAPNIAFFGKLSLAGVFAFRTSITSTFSNNGFIQQSICFNQGYVILTNHLSDSSTAQWIIINETTGLVFRVLDVSSGSWKYASWLEPVPFNGFVYLPIWTHTDNSQIVLVSNFSSNDLLLFSDKLYTVSTGLSNPHAVWAISFVNTYTLTNVPA